MLGAITFRTVYKWLRKLCCNPEEIDDDDDDSFAMRPCNHGWRLYRLKDVEHPPLKVVGSSIEPDCDLVVEPGIYWALNAGKEYMNSPAWQDPGFWFKLAGKRPQPSEEQIAEASSRDWQCQISGSTKDLGYSLIFIDYGQTKWGMSPQAKHCKPLWKTVQNVIGLSADIRKHWENYDIGIDPDDDYTIYVFGRDFRDLFRKFNGTKMKRDLSESDSVVSSDESEISVLSGTTDATAVMKPLGPDRELLRWHFYFCLSKNIRGPVNDISIWDFEDGEPFSDGDLTEDDGDSYEA